MTQLTPVQALRLAEIIDIWYFEWKEKIVQKNVTHKLGFAKEDLKSRIERDLM